MNFFRNLKIRTKLLACFLMLAILVMLVGGMGTVGLGDVNNKSNDMYSNNLQKVYMLTDIKQNLTQIGNDMLLLLYGRDESSIQIFKDDIESNKTEDDTFITNIEKITLTSEEESVWKNFKDLMEQYRAARDEVITLIDAKSYDQALEKDKLIQPIKGTMFDELNKLIKINTDAAKASNDNNKAVFEYLRTVILILTIIGIVFAILFAFLMNLSIAKPIKVGVEMLKVVAKGDFTGKIEDKYLTRKDEVGELTKAVNEMKSGLAKVIRAIQSNSQDMSALSEELSATVEEVSAKMESINHATKNISNGMQDTSATAQEINASVEEVDANINLLSEKAAEGSNVSVKIKERAIEAQRKSKASRIESRRVYEEKEQKIIKAIEDGKVVGEIKEMADTIASIAGQTNLLALNAAIEAARAGEQGKGFTVVADEVRKLAEQSGEAVTIIQETILKVQKAFENLSSNSGEILKFINEDVEPQFHAFEETGKQYYDDAEFVSKMSEEIAAMSEELSATVDQVSNAVENMTEATQRSTESTATIEGNIDETTSGMDQVAKSAQTQAEMAQNLNEMVLDFKI